MNGMEKNNVRYVALDLLMHIEKQGGFSHLVISQAIERENVKEIDQNLLTEIVYGTLEHKLTLDYYLQPFIQKQKKLADWVHILLRMSLFQLLYLDKVPAYAVINEAVEIAKIKGHRGIGSLVNGVLRNVNRQGVRDIEDIEDPLERLSIKTSHPLWLVELWNEAYGLTITEQICEANKQKKLINVRANRLKANKETILSMLKEAEIEAEPSAVIEHGINIVQGNIVQSELMQEGYVTVQDISSMLAAKFMQVEPRMKVLDTCSAPGGKTTYLAEAMDNTGEVYAYDLHKNKLKLIEGHAERLGLTNIQVDRQDARKLTEIHEAATFDRILVDAPCSGLGVIRSKPDIIYNKSIDDIERLQQIQINILAESSQLLKKDGKLVYSTCTINPLENEEVVEQFLQDYPTFEVDESFLTEIDDSLFERANKTAYGIQIFPHTFNSDGFFMTRLIRK